MQYQLQDTYQQITDQIVAAIEAGTSSRVMPWHQVSGGRLRPTNVASKRPYRGLNLIALWASSRKHGYESGLWGTLRQWNEQGARVRQGERGTRVVYWYGTEPEPKPAAARPVGEPGSEKRAILARGYTVFNAGQLEKFEKPVFSASEIPADDRIRAADEFVKAVAARMRHAGGRAFYDAATDTITLPPYPRFRNGLSYYAVLAHELIHWSGAPHRLNRNLSGRFGSRAHAAEELVAELGAAFLAARLGIPTTLRSNHAAYIASWLELLRSDRQAVFTAAVAAEKAADWLEHRAMANTAGRVGLLGVSNSLAMGKW